MSNKLTQYDSYGGNLVSNCTSLNISGRDPSHIQKASLLYSRYIAKSLVFNGLCHRVSVQLYYAEGFNQPLYINVDSFNTCREGINDSILINIIKDNFDLSLQNMINELDLRRPFNMNMHLFGFFGKKETLFKWENPKVNLKGLPQQMKSLENGHMENR